MEVASHDDDDDDDDDDDCINVRHNAFPIIVYF
jgi:hypothetical protein